LRGPRRRRRIKKCLGIEMDEDSRECWNNKTTSHPNVTRKTHTKSHCCAKSGIIH
jgi:hypothetical protein